METASDLVLYCGEAGETGWTRLCLRQADRVMLVASAHSPFIMPAWLAGTPRDWRRPLDLVEARNAVAIAEAAGAAQYASSSLEKAKDMLQRAEDYYQRKQGQPVEPKQEPRKSRKKR